MTPTPMPTSTPTPLLLQYMSLPTSSAERSALVPVIATLLQLSSAELSALQTALKAPLWGTLPVKTVKPMKPPGAGASSHGSAHGGSIGQGLGLGLGNGKASSVSSNNGSASVPVLPPMSVSASASASGASSNGSARENNNISPPGPKFQSGPATGFAIVSPTGSYSPPPLTSYQGPSLENNSSTSQLHPMLDRSDTSDDALDLDIGHEDTPEIHM
jgi:hypothetical protein